MESRTVKRLRPVQIHNNERNSARLRDCKVTIFILFLRPVHEQPAGALQQRLVLARGRRRRTAAGRGRLLRLVRRLSQVVVVVVPPSSAAAAVVPGARPRRGRPVEVSAAAAAAAAVGGPVVASPGREPLRHVNQPRRVVDDAAVAVQDSESGSETLTNI